MSATIKIGGYKATIKNGEWRSDNKQLEQVLNVATKGEESNYKGYDPNPDYTMAVAMVEKFGGKLLRYSEVQIKKGVVY